MQEFAKRFEGVGGSAIRKIFALLADPEMISFAGGNPNPAYFPAKALAEISSEVIAKNGANLLQYGGTYGMQELRGLLKERNKDVMNDTDDIIILTGSSQGIEIFTRVFINPGDTMLVEAPTFLGALQTFMLAEADIKPVNLQDDGIDLTDLEDKIKKFSPKFFYIIPTFQNPSGITTGYEKRRAVYDICSKNNVMILEDDPYGELRYEGDTLPSIKSFDEKGIVCSLKSFSKTISPGMRVGYAIGHKDILHRFNLVKQGQDVHTSNLTQAMIYEFLARGLYEPHVADLCVKYKKQRNAMLLALAEHFPQEVTYTHPMGGLFIWATLPENIGAQALFEKCTEQKVAFVPGQPFYTDDGHDDKFRLNFSMPSIEKISEGIKRMGQIIREFD